MRLRSLLFVPGDRSERMRKALASGADALILDLGEDVARARTVVDAFAAGPGAAVLTLDGKMIDRPRLNRAEALLARV